MIRICFVCQGNICRSTMAEYVFKDLVKKEGLEKGFLIESRGVIADVGSDIHPGTKKMLDKHNIPYSKHIATQLEKNDYDKYDYFIGMDNYNVISMKKIFGTDKKVYKLLDFTKDDKEIDDPWYTHNFNITYEEIDKGCRALLKHIKCKDK